MKKWKLITLICSAILLVGIVVLLIVIFTDKKEETYKFPTVQPTISNPTDVCLEVGNKKVTYKELYDLGLVSYGLTALIDLVDEMIIDVEVTSAELEEHRKNLYAAYNEIELEEVDLEDHEQTEKFIEQMNYQGYMTASEIDAAIKLDLKRNKLAEQMLINDINNFEPVKDKDGNITQEYYFSDSQISNGILNACPDKAEVIYLTFRSASEALQLMDEFDISRNGRDNGWTHKSSGESFTKEEIIDTFVKMYNKLNSTKITDNKYPVYTQKELAEVSSSLALNIFTSLEDINTSKSLKSAMTTSPKQYANGYYYLAVKLSTTKTLTVDQFKEQFKANNLNENAKKVFDEMVDSLLTSTLINTYLYKNRFDLGIKIYDEGLDIKYKNSSDSAMKGYLDLYQGTLEENGTYLVSINVKGQTKYVTPDQLLDLLVKRYGSLLATEFINRYMAFNKVFSSVYDYESGTKLDKYTVFENSEILSYKTALEDGSLEAYGYAKNYGWENFITDYFGVQTEAELVMIGEAYNLAYQNYASSTFKLTNDVVNSIYEKFHLAYELTREDVNNITIEEFEAYLETLNEADYVNTIVYQIMNRLTKYFDVKAGNIKFYVDLNNDTKFDDLTEDTKKLGITLIDALYAIASNSVDTLSDGSVKTLANNILNGLKNNEFSPITSVTGETVGDRLYELVNLYSNSGIFSPTFAVYKQAGIRLAIDTESSYTDESADEELGELLKDVWNQILRKELVINGSAVYFPYTEYQNTAVNAKAAEGISTANPYRIEEHYETDNTVAVVFVTGATNSTWYNYFESSVKMFPMTSVDDSIVIDANRIQQYLDYYILSNRDEGYLTSAEKEQLSAVGSPSTYQKNYINNVIVAAYEEIAGDESITESMYNYRKNAISNGTIKFCGKLSKDNYLKLLEILNKQD